MANTRRIPGDTLSRLILAGGAAVISLMLFFPCVSFTMPPKYFEVENLRLETKGGNITFKFSIGVDNPTGLFEMLKDGAFVELLINAKLERLRTFWTNVTLAEMNMLSSLQHNPLTRDFSLYMPDGDKPLLDKNLDRLLAATWEKFELLFGPVTLLDGTDKDMEYRVTLTLKLQHAKPPPWLAKGFMVWSKDILDPEKVVLDFRY